MKTVLCGSSQCLLVEPSTKTFVLILLYIYHHNMMKVEHYKNWKFNKSYINDQHQRDYLILDSCTYHLQIHM